MSYTLKYFKKGSDYELLNVDRITTLDTPVLIVDEIESHTETEWLNIIKSNGAFIEYIEDNDSNFSYSFGRVLYGGQRAPFGWGVPTTFYGVRYTYNLSPGEGSITGIGSHLTSINYYAYSLQPVNDAGQASTGMTATKVTISYYPSSPSFCGLGFVIFKTNNGWQLYGISYGDPITTGSIRIATQFTTKTDIDN